MPIYLEFAPDGLIPEKQAEASDSDAAAED